MSVHVATSKATANLRRANMRSSNRTEYTGQQRCETRLATENNNSIIIGNTTRHRPERPPWDQRQHHSPHQDSHGVDFDAEDSATEGEVGYSTLLALPFRLQKLFESEATAAYGCRRSGSWSACIKICVHRLSRCHLDAYQPCTGMPSKSRMISC